MRTRASGLARWRATLHVLVANAIGLPCLWRSASFHALLVSHVPATVRRGDSGPDIYTLQTLLNRQVSPVPSLPITGAFEAETERLVLRFQIARRLEPDGVVGRATWRALERAPRSRTAADDESVPRVDDAPWLTIAAAEIGQREIVGERHNARIIEYHGSTGLRATTDEVPWCASFVNWCVRQAGLRGSNSALASRWLSWGEECTEPRAGAVAVIYNASAANSALSRTGNHVGFLLRQTEQHFVLLGGNQSNRVRVSSFARAQWTLRGYRWASE